MHQRTLVLAIAFCLISCKENGEQNTKSSLPTDIASTFEWFSAWEFVSNDIYSLHEYEPVDFVFFDDKNVYSTSLVTIPKGIEINGPSIFGEELKWKKKEHSGQIILPSGEIAPVGLMVFASPLESSSKNSFFIMPLPKFWENSGVQSEMPFELFLTGIFLHEFSHTQQMNGIGAEITRLSETVNFDEDLNDEVVQAVFSKDLAYVDLHKLEHSKIFEAVANNEAETSLKLAKEILELMRIRQEMFFMGNYSSFTELNQLFLTMEGIGQYTMYAWLVHPNGGNMDKNLAFNGTRTKSWIQDDGFGLTVLLSKFSSPQIWGKQVFGNNSETLTDLIKGVIQKNR